MVGFSGKVAVVVNPLDTAEPHLGLTHITHHPVKEGAGLYINIVTALNVNCMIIIDIVKHYDS